MVKKARERGRLLGARRSGEKESSYPPSMSWKKQCIPAGDGGSFKSPLENLPQEILIRIVCGADHDDLKRLFFVSRAVREATVAAKMTHFAYSTPRKTVGFRNSEELSGSPCRYAPKQARALRARLSPKKLAEISVALFRDLALEIETSK